MCIPCARVTLTPFPPHSRLHHNHWTSAPRPAAKASSRGSIMSDPERGCENSTGSAYNPRSDNGVLQNPARTASTVLSVRRQTTRNAPPVAGRCYGREEAFRGVTFTMGSFINEERDPRGSVTELGRTACQPHLRIPAIRRLFGGRLTLARAHHHCVHSRKCVWQDQEIPCRGLCSPRKSQDNLGA